MILDDIIELVEFSDLAKFALLGALHELYVLIWDFESILW